MNTDLKLLISKLNEAFKEAKKSDRSFERALHFRGAMFDLEEELFLFIRFLESMEKENEE